MQKSKPSEETAAVRAKMQIPAPRIMAPPEALPDLETLKQEYEAKKQAATERIKAAQVPVEEPEEELPQDDEFNDDGADAPVAPAANEETIPLKNLIDAYQNNGQFRTELIFQFVEMNKRLDTLITILQNK